MKPTGLQGKRWGATTLFTPLVLLGVLTGGSPTRTLAQTVTPADLVGSWARQGETKVLFTFRADSTVTLLVSAQAGQRSLEGPATGRWRLVGDTLILSQVKSQARGLASLRDFSVDPRLVTFKDGLLTLKQLAFTLPNGAPNPHAATAASTGRVYHRVEPEAQPIGPAAKP